MRRLIIDGFSLEFFLEGGRSRTGKPLPPKVGLLSLVANAALDVRARPIYFAPVSIGYERVPEEKSYVHELSGGEKKKEDVQGLLAAGLLRQRYGRISVQFGELFTLEGVMREFDDDRRARAARAQRSADVSESSPPSEGAGAPESLPPSSLNGMTPARRRALVTRLAYRAMHDINRVTAVTAGALVAAALLTHDKRG